MHRNHETGEFHFGRDRYSSFDHAHARSANIDTCMALMQVADTSTLCLGHQQLEYSHHVDHLLAGTPQRHVY